MRAGCGSAGGRRIRALLAPFVLQEACGWQACGWQAEGACSASLLQSVAGDDLGLDPTNDLAFPLGVTLTSAGSIDLTMTALTVDTGTAVPEPTSMALIGLGLAAMAGVARRKKA